MRFLRPSTGEQRNVRRFAWWPIRVDNTIDLAKVKAERDAAIEALEKIMLQGGSSTDTCSYCGNEDCYNRDGHNVCNPVWTGRQHATKLLNCGECDQRFTCDTKEEDCDRLYHSAGANSEPFSGPKRQTTMVGSGV